MTLKNKLAKLKGLQTEEAKIKDEIANIRNRVENTNMRKYNYEELRDKYNKIDFNNITQKQLSDLMLEDFSLSNLDNIEKQELYNHNMKILQSILNNIPTRTITNVTDMDDMMSKARQIIQNRDSEQEEIKCINIESNKKGAVCYDEEYYDETTIQLLNNLIDVEYIHNLKILKTYCIYCHYRDIFLPSQEELDEIKDALEGWKYLDTYELRKLPKGTFVIYLKIEKGRIKLTQHDNIKFEEFISNKKIKLRKGQKTFYSYGISPIFRKIELEDINN